MTEKRPHQLTLTDQLRLTLGGKLTAEEWAELQQLVAVALSDASAEPPRGKFRKAESPDEVVAQLTDDIQRDSAANAEREAARAAQPPLPDELASLRPKIAAAVRDALDAGVLIKAKVKKPKT